MSLHPAFVLLVAALVADAILVLVFRHLDKPLPPQQDAGYDENAVEPPEFGGDMLTGPDRTRSDVRPVLGKPWPHLRDGRGEESR